MALHIAQHVVVVFISFIFVLNTQQTLLILVMVKGSMYAYINIGGGSFLFALSAGVRSNTYLTIGRGTFSASTVEGSR